MCATLDEICITSLRGKWLLTGNNEVAEYRLVVRGVARESLGLVARKS